MSYKGKIPFAYDKNSKSFKEGAFKNWPNGDPTCNASRKLAQQDREFLEAQRRV
jgi:hypothetical protein